MIILGLTGSIGMGKSATAAMFRAAGVPVYDADAEVARLYIGGGAAVAPIEAAFPGVTSANGVDREALRARVIGNGDAMKALEAVVHPLTRQAQEVFISRRRDAGETLVVLDIPLLFEVGGEGACDFVAVVTAPAPLQRARVLARPGMDEARLAAILQRQMPDADKRARADFIVSSAFGYDFTRAHVQAIIELLANQANAERLDAERANAKDASPKDASAKED